MLTQKQDTRLTRNCQVERQDHPDSQEPLFRSWNVSFPVVWRSRNRIKSKRESKQSGRNSNANSRGMNRTQSSVFAVATDAENIEQNSRDKTTGHASS